MSLSAISQDKMINQVITDPSVTDRCKSLLKKKNDKVAHRQKISTLMKRSERLLHKHQQTKRNALTNIELALKKLKQEHYLSHLKIKVLEETIVRKGCPGVLL